MHNFFRQVQTSIAVFAAQTKDLNATDYVKELLSFDDRWLLYTETEFGRGGIIDSFEQREGGAVKIHFHDCDPILCCAKLSAELIKRLNNSKDLQRDSYQINFK